jgi:uncharacterized membrane protein YGL010W
MDKTGRERAFEQDIQLGVSSLVALGVEIMYLQHHSTDGILKSRLKVMRDYVDIGLENLDYNPADWNDVYTYRD